MISDPIVSITQLSSARLAWHRTRAYYTLEILWGCAAGVYLSYVTIYLGSIHDIGWNGAALILGVSMLAQAALEVPLGYAADRFGKCRVICAAYWCLLGSMFAYFSATSIHSKWSLFAVVLVAELLFGAANALKSGALEAWIVNYRKSGLQDTDCDILFTHSHGVWSISVAATGTITLMLHRVFVSGPWIIAIVSAICAIIVSSLFVGYGGDEQNNGESESHTDLSFGTALNKLAQTRGVILLTVSSTIIYLSSFFVGYFYLPIIKMAGAPASIIGCAFVLVNGSRWMGSLFSKSQISRGIGRNRRLLVGILIHASLLAATGLSVIMLWGKGPALWCTLLALVVLTRGVESTVAPSLLGLMNDLVPRDDLRATAMSCYGFSTSFSVFLVSMLRYFFMDPSRGTDSFGSGIGWTWVVVALAIIAVSLPSIRRVLRD